MIGKTLAHYEIEGSLGEGGSGVVYRGRDLRLGRPVAIKVLADGLRDDELAWARLLREARLASQLTHPQIAAIYDLGEESGCAYIVMEYIEGLPLADLIPHGGMPIEQIDRYGAQIASALGFAHEQGVIHGDLKGSNIIVSEEGNIKLLDFGLARRIPRAGMAEVTSSCLPLAEAGTTAGTLPYLAPEILRGDSPNPRSDLWSMGVLLYQMAAGELPFRGSTPFELCVEIMVGTPPGFGRLPQPLQSTLRRALEKEPSARFASVRELSQALTGAARSAGPEAPGPLAEGPIFRAAAPTATSSAMPRTGKWWLTVGAATAFCTLLLGGIYVGHFRGMQQLGKPVSELKAPQPVGAENPAIKVWVNTDSGTYHCPGTRWYGKTQTGQYMTQQEARAKGFHPAANHACR